MTVRFHVLSRKEAREAVVDIFGRPGPLRPSAIVSISDSEPPPHAFVAAGVPLLALQFEDVPRDLPSGYKAPTREHVEQLIAWWVDHKTDGDVIVHCAAGISRSSACALTLIALNNGGVYMDKIAARSLVLDLLASVHDTHQQGLRDDVGIRPNPRIVWLADQILGWDGHLLAAVEDVFAMRSLWVDLGEEPPKGWPGRAA